MKLKEFARESKYNFNGSKKDVPIVGLEHLNSGEMLFSDYDLNTENTFTKSFSKGQVLFGRRRAYLKKAAFAEFDGICSGDITVIEAIPGKVLPELLPFIIQNDKLFDFAISRSAGGLSPRVKWKDLAEFEFDLPSLADQKKLADKLWAAYRLKESYKKLLASMNELAKSRFIEMFGDPVLNDKNWETKKIADVAPVRNYNGVIENKVWLLNLDMVESQSGEIIDYIYVEKSTLGSSICSFDESNVLYSKLRPYLNKVILPKYKGVATSELLPLRPKKELDRFFLAHLLRSDSFVEYISNKVAGSKMPRVSMVDFRNFDCILPPIEFQISYKKYIQQLDKSKSELKKSIAAIDDVIKSLIN